MQVVVGDEDLHRHDTQSVVVSDDHGARGVAIRDFR